MDRQESYIKGLVGWYKNNKKKGLKKGQLNNCSRALKHLANGTGVGYALWGTTRFKSGVKIDIEQLSINACQALYVKAEKFCKNNRPEQCNNKNYNEGVNCNLLRPLKKYINFKKEQEHSQKEAHPMEVLKPKRGIGRNKNTDQENVQGNKLNLANNSVIN